MQHQRCRQSMPGNASPSSRPCYLLGKRSCAKQTFEVRESRTNRRATASDVYYSANKITHAPPPFCPSRFPLFSLFIIAML